jgi:hypothetical protein
MARQADGEYFWWKTAPRMGGLCDFRGSSDSAAIRKRGLVPKSIPRIPVLVSYFGRFSEGLERQFELGLELEGLGRRAKPSKRPEKLACPAGFEPATHGLEGRCSVRAELRAAERLSNKSNRDPRVCGGRTRRIPAARRRGLSHRLRRCSVVRRAYPAASRPAALGTEGRCSVRAEQGAVQELFRDRSLARRSEGVPRVTLE